MSPETVIEFWFSEKTQPLWFNSTPEFDLTLKKQFGDAVQAAAAGKYGDWEKNATGSLALIILLDQMPLNIYRGQAEGFVTETAAIRITKQSIELGYDLRLLPAQRAFMYMPLMHSESMADQQLSVKSFAGAGMEKNLEFAVHHRGIVERFGRFPHRNQILGRVSTEEEEEWLASEDAFVG